jgi:anti-anti-sigma regulatory factor
MGVNLTPVSDDGAEARLAADGDVRMAGAAIGANPFADALGPAWAGRRVLVDCGRATSIDSAAMGWLMSVTREFRKGGGMAVLHSFPQRLQQILDMMRVGQVVPIAPDEAAGRQALAGGYPAHDEGVARAVAQAVANRKAGQARQGQPGKQGGNR